MSKLKIDRLLRRAKAINSDLERSKELYNELETIVYELKRLKFKSSKNAILIDNFKDVNKVYRATSFKRFEIKFI